MKKILTLVLALMLALSLVACGGKDDPKPSGETKPGASQQGSDAQSETTAPDGGQSGAIDPDNSQPSDDDISNNDTIAVYQATRAYSGGEGLGFAMIELVYTSFAPLELTAISAVDAAEAGFSTDSGFTLTTVETTGNKIFIYFEATEEDYDITDITYTKPANPVITCTDGTEIESFSYEVPYNNLDLYE